LLAKDGNGLTAWDIAASICNKEILEKLWGSGREVQVNLKDDLLLVKSVDEVTAWDIATKKHNRGISEKPWGWDREEQVNLKDDLLLAKGDCV
jgi:hypothetical protein